MKNLEFSTFLSIILALLLIFLAIFLSNGKITHFIDLPSILIVVFGTFLTTTACFSLKEVLIAHSNIFNMILFKPEDSRNIAISLLKISVYTYKNGLMKLENIYKDINQHSSIFTKGIEYVADGSPPKVIENITLQEINTMAESYQTLISILRKSGEIAPAMGLIGTLIGLVQMLESLQDVSRMGPSMSVALLTTFYGAILAYVIFFPLASKFENNAQEQLINARLYAKALISISKHENPRQLEIMFNSVLPPEKRIVFFNI